MRTHRQLSFIRQRNIQIAALRLVRRAFGDELFLELADKALHRPGTRFAEGADGAATGNVVRNLDEVIGVLLATVAVSQAMECLAHPKRTFAARRALTAAFVRVELTDVREHLDDVREGSLWMSKTLHRLTHGGGRKGDADYLVKIADNIPGGRTICAFGEACSWPVQSFVGKFKDEFVAKGAADEARRGASTPAPKAPAAVD